jgi:hypothetical protein
MFLVNSYQFGGGVVAGLLLDLYPNADVAYSLRLLRTAYSGNAIRVRRSSDNTEQDIGFVGNDLDTASLLTFCGAGNGFVTTWYDQSENTRNATQTTAIFQPQIVLSGALLTVNSKTCMSLDGTNDRLNITSFNFNSTNYNSFVGKRQASGRRLYGLGGNQYVYALWFDNKYYLQSKSTGFQTSSALDTTTNQLLLTGLNNGTDQEIYKNSNVVASTFVPFTLATAINAIGAYVGSNFAYCELQEIVFYNSDQSANRTAIETNINDYYAIY